MKRFSEFCLEAKDNDVKEIFMCSVLIVIVGSNFSKKYFYYIRTKNEFTKLKNYKNYKEQHFGEVTNEKIDFEAMQKLYDDGKARINVYGIKKNSKLKHPVHLEGLPDKSVLEVKSMDESYNLVKKNGLWEKKGKLYKSELFAGELKTNNIKWVK